MSDNFDTHDTCFTGTMGKWKLIRQTFGSEEYNLTEGETVTVGRAVNNNITLTSIVISRNHCVLNVKNEQVLITDLKSSNGVYVGLKRIPPNIPYALEDSDIIGIGWTIGAPLVNINDNEKYVFKLIQENKCPISSRITYQSENEIDELENHVSELLKSKTPSPANITSPLNKNLSLKRKLDDVVVKTEATDEKKCRINKECEIVNLLSDSDNDMTSKKQASNTTDKVKLKPIKEDANNDAISYKDQIKMENEFLEFEAFNVKQEYLGDDEPINIDSDSDSESGHWFMRLSQSSPGKPFIKVSQEEDVRNDDNSYSQLDDFVPNITVTDPSNEEEEFIDDPITILPQPLSKPTDSEEFLDDIISLDRRKFLRSDDAKVPEGIDTVDGSNSNQNIEQNAELPIVPPLTETASAKKIQLIDPQVHGKKTKSYDERKKSSSKHSKTSKHSSKIHISNSQKEERKKKLKEIAAKDKVNEEETSKNTSNNSIKTVTNVKVTSTNRGAFLTDAVQIVKPKKRKDGSKKKSTETSSTTKSNKEKESITSPENGENKKKKDKKHNEKHSKHKSKHESAKSHKSTHDKVNESRVPLKSLKPLTGSEDSNSRKPFTKVEPLKMGKPKKQVRFSENEPEVHIFEIDPGNKMKKTSLAKMSLVDCRQMPVFSLEKITLMKILRWNPHWLEEQINNNNPPPILGHNSPPMTVFHSFASHQQYVQLVGDLLLMEIWECLTLAYMKIRNIDKSIPMRIGSLPPIPTPERCYDLFSISVDISVPSNEAKNVPRVGEIILATFGQDNTKCSRFFYVHNVRCLPSPPNNIHSFYCISLHATFTEKMKSLRLGEVIMGRPLAYINKELNLFEAMEYLAGSPLSEAILRPEPRHFQNCNSPVLPIKSQWTKTLNPSQQAAVLTSVKAALGDRPSIQMVQGPPGTGKSSVICAIVMTYFYDENSRRQQNRGKILICATSNAAVDELVIRLLNIRQSLPKNERFRMVRVGRAEAMHGRAREVSSQQLAQRDAARPLPDPTPYHGLDQEIAHLQAKINMWKSAASDAKDAVRVAYCEGRITELQRRIALVRPGGGSDGGEEVRPEQMFMIEKRIIDGADIIVTTLASALNHKMKGLKRRIALCIVDEAGQAIEPETLIPLTLDVTRLTLIGDPQQLPGYICSQRAKQHGLGESLFSRLAACSMERESASILLDRQYRMHPAIADYPNRAFYGGRVTHAPPAPPRPALPVPPYAILSITSGDKGQGPCGANEMEACGVSRLVVALGAALQARGLSLAVITPYNAHKELIKKYIRTLQDQMETAGGVEVNTVDSFQGQERDVVVVSLARSHGVGFLTDAGRMNVMLTRARHSLLICLNPHAMLKNNQWRTLVEDAQIRNMYKVLPNKLCQPMSAGQIPHSEILKYVNN